MPVATVAELLNAIAALQVLPREQLDSLLRTRGTFADVKALAKVIVDRQLLTAWQVRHIANDKGSELLLGNYLLLDKLGGGGMGAVYKARHRGMGRVVALKVLRPEKLLKADSVRRFQRELRIASQLAHPNIVATFDTDEVAGQLVMVMEYVEGADLARQVKERGPVPILVARDYIAQAALGLQYAADRGLVHRDIKPHNLLVTNQRTPATPFGVLKILDLGLARFDAGDDDAESSLTHEGAVVGTPDYIAPEQLLNARTVDHRADLYSLGCTFHYLLTGQPPFPGGTVGERLMKHQMEAPVPVQQLRPDVPADIAALVARLLAKRPDDRVQSAAEVVNLLRGATSPGGVAVAPPWLDLLDAATTREDSSTKVFARRRKQRATTWWLLLSAVGCLGLMILLGSLLVLALLFQPTPPTTRRGTAPAVNNSQPARDVAPTRALNPVP